MRNSNWWIWMILFFALLPLLGSVVPVLFIAWIIYAVIKNSTSNLQGEKRQNNFYGYENHYNQSANLNQNQQELYAFLESYMRTHEELNLSDNYKIVKGSDYHSGKDLIVYNRNVKVASLGYLAIYHKRLFSKIYQECMQSKKAGFQNESTTVRREGKVVDVEYEDVKQSTDSPKEEQKQSRGQRYIEEVNDLNDEIPDDKISESLYETVILLKQLDLYENKFPESKQKVDDLYDRYLPMLIKILKQFSVLQIAKTDISYEKSLNQTTGIIKMTNQAIKKLITEMTDHDFINYNADISTLEALLQKDGLLDDDFSVKKEKNNG